MKKIFTTLGLAGLGGWVYLQQTKIDLNNNLFKNILSRIHQQNPKASTVFLKYLIGMRLFKSSPILSNYIFSADFDPEGHYLESLLQLGFDTVELGPISLMPSSLEQQRQHFGYKILLANLNTYLSNSSNSNQSKIAIHINPNFQVLKYTPYLIEQNLIECLKEFDYLNQLYDHTKLPISYYILSLNDDLIKTISPHQYLNMLNSIVKQTHKIVKPPPKITRNIPKVYISILSETNKQIYKTVDQSSSQASKTQTIQFTLPRITLQDLPSIILS